MKERPLVTALIALALLATAMVLVAVIAVSSGDDSTSTGIGTQPSVTTATTTPSVAEDRWLERERSGELHTMLQQHQAMMQQMQASASPQMLEIMRNDPMWQMLESGELIKEMEEHQDDINQMLAQPGE